MKSALFVLAMITLLAVAISVTSCGIGDQSEKPLEVTNNTSQPIQRPEDKSDKADLIIESVTYRSSPPNPMGMSGSLALEYTLRIRNIGIASVTTFFYISNTRSKDAFDKGYYEAGQMVNAPKEIIAPGGALEVKVLDFVDYPNAKRVRFLITTEGKPLKPGLEALPGLDEDNYENNTYELEIIWPIPESRR